jgi:hypothetical protein
MEHSVHTDEPVAITWLLKTLLTYAGFGFYKNQIHIIVIMTYVHKIYFLRICRKKHSISKVNKGKAIAVTTRESQ